MQMPDSKTKIISTSDFVEASVLRYFDHPLEHVDKTQKRAVFHFKKGVDTDTLLKQYEERALVVEPFAFYQCEREMKARLYNNRTDENLNVNYGRNK